MSVQSSSVGQVPTDATAQDTQAETATTPQGTGETPATTTTPSASSNNADSSTTANNTNELDSLKAALKRANAEAASHRHKAKELDDLKAQIENEKLTETQKLQKQLDELKAQNAATTQAAQARAIDYEVKLRAAQLGIIDPDVAAKLLDTKALTFGNDGTPDNVEDLLKDLLKAKPYLSGAAQTRAATSGGATNPSRSQSSAPPALTDAVIATMSPEEYRARRTEIQAWRATHPPRF